MAGRKILGNVKVVAKRDFWSFQVVHAVVGGLLTLGGAAGALIIGDGMKNSIAEIDERVAEIDARLESIRSTLVQFRVVQSNGIILGALASGEGVRPEYSESFTKLMFVLRRGPAMSLLAELYPADLENFTRERDELDRLQALAIAPDRTRQSWDDFLNFEMTREGQVMELQDRFLAEKADLHVRRQNLEASVDTATVAGFIVQQIGFVIILLAGLIYQHVRSSASPPRILAESG